MNDKIISRSVFILVMDYLDKIQDLVNEIGKTELYVTMLPDWVKLNNLIQRMRTEITDIRMSNK